jgi:hypothetical protein
MARIASSGPRVRSSSNDSRPRKVILGRHISVTQQQSLSV